MRNTISTDKNSKSHADLKTMPGSTKERPVTAAMSQFGISEAGTEAQTVSLHQSQSMKNRALSV